MPLFLLAGTFPIFAHYTFEKQKMVASDFFKRDLCKSAESIHQQEEGNYYTLCYLRRIKGFGARKLSTYFFKIIINIGLKK
jgi:hypothetical protein